jgi:O-antigen biosynthesis protein
MTTLSWTGERYLPWWEGPATAYEHWHRYAYAAQFASGKNVLDLASGEGYGSATLAAAAGQVVALDIAENAVKHARMKYRSPNLHFIVGSIMEMPLRNSRFDVIVCFEAIEHIADPEALLIGVKRLLKPGGLFLVSTPNKPEYKKTEPSNPFHVKELDFEEFQAMLSRHFRRTQFLGQRVYCSSSLWTATHKTSRRISEYLLDRDHDEFVLAGADTRIPLYFIGIASDADEFPEVAGAVLVDSSNALLKEAARVQAETAAHARSLDEALAWKEDQLQQSQTALSWKEDQLQQAQDSLLSQQQALAWKEDQLQQSQTALSWKEDQLQQAQNSLLSQQQALAWKEDQLQQAQTSMRAQEQALAWRENLLRQSQTAVSWLENQLQQAQTTIHSHEEALAWRESQVNEFTNSLHILRSDYERAAAELSAIKSGRLWRSIQKILKIRNRLLPPGTRRRSLYDRWTHF